MNEDGLVFTAATGNDTGEIWDLLHAVSIHWSEQKIREEICRIYLLWRGRKLLGALLTTKDGSDIEWVAVHPFYPETRFHDLLIENWQSLHLVRERESCSRPISCLKFGACGL